MTTQKELDKWQVEEVKLWALNTESLYLQRKQIAEEYLRKKYSSKELLKAAENQAKDIIENLQRNNKDESFQYVSKSVVGKATKEILKLIREEIKEEQKKEEKEKEEGGI